MDIEIIWSDEEILLVNKPAGLLTIQDGYDSTLPYIVKILQPQYGKLFIVHRLDRDTSGILLLARNSQSHRFLNEQFQNRQTQKMYHVIIIGNPLWNEYLANHSLVKALPHTGYTHQIRAHLVAAGFPILADPLYSKPQISPNEPQFISRMALHASLLSFIHPTSHTTLSMEAPYPSDFQNALNLLRQVN